MKTPLMLISFLLIFITTYVSAQKGNNDTPTPQEAADFNNKIIDQTDAVITAYNEFINTWQEYEYRDPDLSLLKDDFKSLQEQIKTSLNNLDFLDEFDGKNEFKNAAIKYVNSYKSIVDQEWMEIMELLKKGKKFEKKDEERCNKLALKIDEITGDADNEYFAFQKSFAKKYKFTLE
jgi:hypothetical protein